MDQSVTCLAGRKIGKASEILEALGDLDELNSSLGMSRALSKKPKLKKQLFSLQEELILIGGWLAGQTKTIDLKNPTEKLQAEIKKEAKTDLKHFSRPGQNQISASLHFNRAIARRLERRVVSLGRNKFLPLIGYLNKLSLFLFWLAVKEEEKGV